VRFSGYKPNRLIAVWLAAVLAVLSFVSSAHSVSHLDEGANSHCTLCFHQHQLNKLLPGTASVAVPAGVVRELPVSEPVFAVTAASPSPQARGPPAAP
jgi:hypothetical protein